METLAADSPVGPTARPLPSYPTIAESWGVLGWYMLVVIALCVPMVAAMGSGYSQALPMLSLLLIPMANLALFRLLRWKAGPRWQHLQVVGDEKAWLYALLPLLVLATGVVLELQDYLHLPNFLGPLKTKLAPAPATAFLVTVLLGPLTEELLFRGVVLQGLLRNARPWVAIAQSALLFAIFHFNPAQSLNAFFLGLLFGWLYYRTRSLVLCAAYHSLHNLVAYLLGMGVVGGERQFDAFMHASPGRFAGLVGLSALVAGSILWRVHQTTAPAPEAADPAAGPPAASAAELA